MNDPNKPENGKEKESIFDEFGLDGKPIKKEEPTKSEEPKKEEPKEDPYAEIQSVREHLMKLAEKVNASRVQAPAKEEDLKIEQVKFVDDFDEETGLTADILNKALQSSFEMGVKETLKHVKKELASSSAQTQNAVTAILMSEKFFQANPDLEAYRPYVGMKWDQIVEKEPNINFTKLFTQLEKEVREDLRLTKPDGNGKDNNNSSGDPAFPKKPSVQRPQDIPAKTEKQKELDELSPTRR